MAEFQASWGNTVRPCLQKPNKQATKKLDPVAHICNLSTHSARWKAETRELPKAHGPASLEYTEWQNSKKGPASGTRWDEKTSS